MINSRLNNSAAHNLPSTSDRAESSVVRSSSKVWRSRSDEIAPTAADDEVKHVINSCRPTVTAKMALPKLCKLRGELDTLELVAYER